jgi:hypothetical protein
VDILAVAAERRNLKGATLARGYVHPNAFWAAFDRGDRLDGRQRHVVGNYWLGKVLAFERANLHFCDACLERCIDALTA